MPHPILFFSLNIFQFISPDYIGTATPAVDETATNTLERCIYGADYGFTCCVYRKNEEIDDKSMIRRLRKRIAELETEVALLKAGQVSLTFRFLFNIHLYIYMHYQ